MSPTAVQALVIPAAAHKVVWFAPDRPVEGNTIYRRYIDDSPAETDLPDSAVPDANS